MTFHKFGTKFATVTGLTGARCKLNREPYDEKYLLINKLSNVAVTPVSVSVPGGDVTDVHGFL